MRKAWSGRERRELQVLEVGGRQLWFGDGCNGYGGGPEAVVWEVALAMEEEEEAMVVEDPDMAPSMGATEVVRQLWRRK